MHEIDSVKCPSARAFLSRARDAGLRIRENTTSLFTDWVADVLRRYYAAPALHRIFLVSGELNTTLWNTLVESPLPQGMLHEESVRTIGDYLERHCSVHGVCCHYIDASELKEAPTSETVLARKLNHAVRYFLQHARDESGAANKRMRLYCSNIRLDGHWFCAGNRLCISDWHAPVERPEEKETKGKTKMYEVWSGIDDEKADASDSRVQAFAEREFSYVLADLRAYWTFDPAARKQYSLWYNRHFSGDRGFNYANCTLHNAMDDCGIPFLVGREDVGAEGDPGEDWDDKTFVFLRGATIRNKYNNGSIYFPPDPESEAG